METPLEAEARQGTQGLPNVDIAIVGMAGRFPGARNLDEYWAHLEAGRECVVQPTDDELLAQGEDAAKIREPSYVRAAPVLDGIDEFDAQFFNISAGEARVMDPQRRIFMELCWTALEDANCIPGKYGGAVGVFAGAGVNAYVLRNLLVNERLVNLVGELQILSSNDKDGLPTQVSYHLGLTGPSLNVNTACSSGLVALHLARQSLLLGECDVALAGASALVIPNRVGYTYQPGSILSPDGHCRAFDARARGTLWGSGAGVVALKRYTDAVADGDRIRAVIKGSAINNDGAAKAGYTAPSINGQAEVIAAAYAAADVSPDTVSYLEAHGTGTELGDPIEIAALTLAFREETARKQYCGIGSVKTNIGHLGAAAGMASLIKSVLALEHRTIPASLHFEHANPKIDFENSPFRVVARTEPWKNGHGPRRAGISSLGVGGTNAHVIVEEAPATTPGPREPHGPVAITLSAKSGAALDRMRGELADALERGDPRLIDVAHTLQVGRGDHAVRLGFLAESREEAVRRLREGDTTIGAERQDTEAARKLACWLRGEAVDWQPTYRAGKPRKIGLPTYAFERSRHWVDPVRPSLARMGGGAAAQTSGPVRGAGPEARAIDGTARSFYAQVWSESPRALAVPRSWAGKRVVVVGGGEEVASQVAGSLGARGAEVVTVRPGQGWEEAAGRFTVRFDDEDEMERLFGAVECPDAIVDLRGLGAGQGGDAIAQTARELESLLAMVKGLTRARPGGNVELLFCADGIASVTGGEAQRLEFAWVPSLCTVLRQEFGGLRCHYLDVEPGRHEELALRIADELGDAQQTLDVAYRGGRRWVKSYQPLPVPEDAPVVRAAIRPGAVYLGVGGLTGNGVATTIYKELLRRGARLLLVEAYPMRPRDQWPQWCAANAPGNAERLRMEMIQELEGKGAVYLGHLAREGDQAAIQAALAKAEAEHGPVAGVFHSAGSCVSGRLRPISLIDRDFCEENLGVGVRSLALVDGLLGERALDFRHLMISLSTVFGGPGFLSYAAANAVAAAYASSVNRRSPGRWAVTCWDSWAAEFEGVLEDTLERIVGGLGSRLWADAMTTPEGLACFDRLDRAGRASPVIVCKGDFDARYAAWVVGAGTPAREGGVGNRQPRPELSTPFLAPRTELETKLAEIFSEVLGVERVGVNDDFFDLGGTSLIGIQLVAAIRAQLGVNLGIELLLEKPNVASVAAIFPAPDAGAPGAERSAGAER